MPAGGDCALCASVLLIIGSHVHQMLNCSEACSVVYCVFRDGGGVCQMFDVWNTL